MSTNNCLLTREETAKRLHITPRTLFNLTKPRGKLPAVHLGRRVMYDPSDLDSFIEKSKGVARG